MKLVGVDLDMIRAHPNIESIEQDGVFTLPTGEQPAGRPATRRSSPGILPKLSYTQKRATGLGQGVDVYVLDTGIYIGHNSFGGRATFGANFADGMNDDRNGHGTHTAATVGGNYYGIARGASLIAVKVLGDDGSGYTADIVAGLNWVAIQSTQNNRPAVATMSLGGLISQSMDSAVKATIAQGIHVTAAAGNDNLSAFLYSPARVEEANTIGAANTTEGKTEKASFSNWGKRIDVWAPGVDILSAWIGGPDAVNTISGTSMATPYVAGILALVLGEHGPMSPAQLSAQMKEHAKPVVTPDNSLGGLASLLFSNNLFVQPW